MSQTVVRNASTLKFLASAKPQLRKAILKSADKELIQCICECIYNTIQGKVPLTINQKKKLCHHKKDLRIIAQRGGSLQKKKKLLLQKGGALLPLILMPLISGILGSLFK